MKYLILVLCCLGILLSSASADNALNDIENTIVTSNIAGIDTSLNDSKVYLNVQVKGEITCKQAITALNIKLLTVKSKIYQPVCTHINGSLIRITYVEQILI